VGTSLKGTAARGALVAAVLVGGSGAAARAAGWEIQPSANPAGAVLARLTAVSCAPGGSCMAVGSYSPDGKQELTLAERWDGIAWTIVHTPNLAGSSDLLAGVSCPAAGSCVAVGFSVTSSSVHTLAETWDGHRWTVTPTPPGEAGSISSLSAVSCDAPASCTAVGGVTAAREEAQAQPLALHWDGSAWAALLVPNPEAENGSALTGVSCLAANACMATGDFVYADVDQSIFAARFDGSVWTLESQPNPRGENFNAESSVSCAAGDSCESVGSWLTSGLVTRPLAEGWNGSGWTRQPTSRPPHAVSATLDGVSCAGAASCAAVGEWTAQEHAIPTLTLAEEWNGVSWTAKRTPSPSGAQSASLAGVSCQPAGCVGAGSYSVAGGTRTLIERNAP